MNASAEPEKQTQFKPNSKPIQSQYKANQSQFKPNQTQFVVSKVEPPVVSLSAEFVVFSLNLAETYSDIMLWNA